MDKEERDLKVAIAKATLSQLVGRGVWRVLNGPGEFDWPDEIVTGLAIGDAVWTYDSSVANIVQMAVVATYEGAGLVCYQDITMYHGPELAICGSGSFFRTRAEAVSAFQVEIQEAFDEAEDCAASAQRLKGMLNEF